MPPITTSNTLIMLRGMTRRCPRCGELHIFRRWFQMKDRCPQCGIFFEREEGYWTGAMAINLVVTELVFAAVAAVVVVRTWPDIPVMPLLLVTLVLNGFMAVFFYPIAKTLWVATDLVLHPLEPDELREVHVLEQMRERSLVD